MEKYVRPKYHFTPSKGWINDPNGLIYYNGVYHLFAQHYPDGNMWGPMHWLHATSSDMIRWHEEGIALYPDDLGLMFSGSACLMQDGRMALMYTAHSKECEQQCVAFSEDGVTFEKYKNNPVIPTPGFRDFRDPKMFWNEKYKCWSVVIAADDYAYFYRSNDLCRWEKTGEFGTNTVHFGDRFECPDCFPLKTAGGETVWVLTASMIFFGDESGCRMRYWLGEFDGEIFHETYSKDKKLRVEIGYESYAGTSWYGLPDRYFQTWMHASSLPSPLESYTGCLSLPRKCTLIDTDEGPRLAFSCVLPEKNLRPPSRMPRTASM